MHIFATMMPKIWIKGQLILSSKFVNFWGFTRNLNSSKYYILDAGPNFGYGYPTSGVIFYLYWFSTLNYQLHAVYCTSTFAFVWNYAEGLLLINCKQTIKDSSLIVFLCNPTPIWIKISNIFERYWYRRDDL